MRLMPVPVSAYSTLGVTSACTARATIPSRSKCRRASQKQLQPRMGWVDREPTLLVRTIGVL
jgi:hypothetical protein